MTPEEELEKQLIRFNNALNHSAEVMARLDANVERHEAEIEKMTAGIRDLIVVSRTLLDAQKATDQSLATSADTTDRLGVRLNQAEESRQRSNEDFDVKFSALIHAQEETERRLQEWIARQNKGNGEEGRVSPP